MPFAPLGLRCSTTVEAVQAGAGMGAGLVMLTHFSQRYPKIPKIDPQFSATTGVACDYMTVGTWFGSEWRATRAG
jgi:ribonuclease Z